MMIDEFEELVADSMRQHAATVRIPADLGCLARLARGRHRRRQLTVRGALATGTAVGAAAAVIAVGTGPQRSESGTLPVQTTAYVVSHAEKALAQADARTIEVIRSSSHGLEVGGVSIQSPIRVRRSTYWSYGLRSTSQNYTANGSKINVVGTASDGPGSGKFTLTQVNDVARTWYRQTGRYLGSANIAVPGHCSPPVMRTWLITTSARWIRYWLRCAVFVVSGRGHVDGVDAIKVILSKPQFRADEAMWLDPTTYLPVRILMYSTAGPRAWMQLDYQWLPPTRANLAHLIVKIPAGYRRVSPPPGTPLSVTLS